VSEVDAVFEDELLWSALADEPKSDWRSWVTAVAAEAAVVVSPDCTAESRLARSFVKVAAALDVPAWACCAAVLSFD
jgi:hypothetical protein